MKTALVAGSTGLVGSALVKLLLQSDRYSSVKAITRSDLQIVHPKLIPLKLDYTKLDDHKSALEADDVFCCLGTTIAKAKSKEKFRQVDYEFPLKLARISSALNSKQYLLVSALGANKKSCVFYNQVKGEVEEDISKVSFQAVHFFRPSLLLGSRKDKRSGEDAAKLFYKIFGFMIPAKFKALHATRVAKAMLHFASLEERGIFFHESGEMQHF